MSAPFAPPGHPQEPLPPPRVEEVSDGVFAYVQPDGGWYINNTGFLVGRHGITSVDTCSTRRRTLALLEAIGQASDRPVRTLVNTHHHGDHTYGNCLLPGATVVGHDRCRQAVLAGGLALQALLEEVDWGELEVWPPFVTFTERLTLYVDDLRVELISAAPAHTDNDIVVWIPERRVLFTGDLVFNGVTPLALMGTVAGWLRSLALVRDLGAERLVPGHGPVCGPEAVAEVEAYLRLVQDMARRGWEASLTPLETARQGREELGRFGEWRDPERLVANLHRAYAELRGEPPAAPLDILAAWRDMEALEGRRLRCLA